jgi:LAO/AO transport system kinase
VQALKAGIMEIADIFVVNKADREGADRTAASIETMLSLEQWPEESWKPPVVRTIATTGAGLPELVQTIETFRARTTEEQGARRRARAEWRLRGT